MNKITSLLITTDYIDLTTEDGTIFTADVDDIISYTVKTTHPDTYGTFQIEVKVNHAYLGKLITKSP